MRRITSARPSPAMVVAVIALSFALVGSSVAATGTLDRAIKKSTVKKIAKKQAKKQANKVVTKRAPGLDVASANTADTASIGLSPVAYATVTPDGNVIEARSRGVADGDVTLEATSAFCFRNLGFAFKTAQVTPVYDGGAASDETAAVSISPDVGFQTDCAAPFQVEVSTTNDATYAPEPFIIWFYN